MAPVPEHVADALAQDRDVVITQVLSATLAYAREREYIGWDYADGTSSNILRALPFKNRWLNLLFQESAKRAPVNIRPLLFVEKRRNYKGTALFAMANLTADRLMSASDWGSQLCDVDYTGEAKRLLDWLIANRSIGYTGFCGGHKHTLQFLDRTVTPNESDAVSTSYAVKALLAGGQIDPMYPQVARTAEEFVVNDLRYREVDGGAKIRYGVHNPIDNYYTPNAAAIGARLLIDLHDTFGDEELRRRATRILDYVVAHQQSVGGWYYRIPPETSRLSMDNHHNGFIIECLQRYHEVTGSDRYREPLVDALSFYRNTLFEHSGAPNFEEERPYPRDIHAAAQGILVFSYADDHEFAQRIIEWTLSNLYAGEGRFYYRKKRFYTKRITLMRWCQAWMAYALAEYLRTVR